MRNELPGIPEIEGYAWNGWAYEAQPVNWARISDLAKEQHKRSNFLANVTGMNPTIDGAPAVESPLGRIELHLLP